MIKKFHSPFSKRKINLIDLEINYLKFSLQKISTQILKSQCKLFFNKTW